MTARVLGYRSLAPWAAACLAAGAVAGAVGSNPAAADPLIVGVRWAVLGALVVAILSRPERGIWALIVTTPLMDYGRIVTWPVPITLAQASLGALLAGWGFRLLAGHIRAHRPNPLQLALGLPLLAAVWSLPLSLNPARTGVGAARLLFLWLFALVFSYFAEDGRRRRRMLEAFVWVGVGLAVVSFAQYAFPQLGLGNVHTQFDAAGVEELMRPAAFYMDTNFLGGYLSVASLVAFGSLVHASSRRAALTWAVPATVCAVAMVLTMSRSALLGFVVGAVVVVLTAPPRRRKALVVALLLAGLMLVPLVPERYVKRVSSLGDVMSEGSLATRILMFASTAEIARDYWGTGTGLSAFEVAYPSYRRIGALPRILRPHEIPLAMPAEMGVAGLIAEAGLLAGLVWAFERARRRGWRAGDALVLAGIVTLLVQSWFQYYLYFEYLWFFAALAAALPAPAEPEGAVVDA